MNNFEDVLDFMKECTKEIEGNPEFGRNDLRRHYKALKLIFSVEELASIYEKTYEKFMPTANVQTNKGITPLDLNDILTILKAATNPKYTNISVVNKDKGYIVYLTEKEMVRLGVQFVFWCEKFVNAAFTAEVKNRMQQAKELKYEYSFVTDSDGRVYTQ